MEEDKDMSELFKKYAAFIPKGYHEALAQLEQKKLERDHWKAEAEKWQRIEEKRRRKLARKQTGTAPGNPGNVGGSTGGKVANLQEVETGKKSGRGGGAVGASGASNEPGPSTSRGTQGKAGTVLDFGSGAHEAMEEDICQSQDFSAFKEDLHGTGSWEEGEK